MAKMKGLEFEIDADECTTVKTTGNCFNIDIEHDVLMGTGENERLHITIKSNTFEMDLEKPSEHESIDEIKFTIHAGYEIEEFLQQMIKALYHMQKVMK